MFLLYTYTATESHSDPNQLLYFFSLEFQSNIWQPYDEVHTHTRSQNEKIHVL